MIIKNVKAYTEDKVFHEKDIHIENGLFCTQSSEPEFIDGNGCYAIPGLIDLHFHGCGGYDFCDGTFEALDQIAQLEAAAGITGICPATMQPNTKKRCPLIPAGHPGIKKAPT